MLDDGKVMRLQRLISDVVGRDPRWRPGALSEGAKTSEKHPVDKCVGEKRLLQALLRCYGLYNA